MEEILQDDLLVLNKAEGLARIGQGNTAEIYEYDRDRILKLFRDGFPEQGVIKEWAITKRIQEVYDGVPKALKYVVYENRRGILYEKASGMDMFSIMRVKPFSVFCMGKRIASIQSGIHKTEIDGVLKVKEKLAQEIGWVEDLTSKEKDDIIGILNTLPAKNNLCHFDFHPGNVMVNDSEYRVIDWLTACSGDPAADIARTWLLLKYGQMRDADWKTRLVVSVVKTVIRGQYLRTVCRLSKIPKTEVKKWIVPVAAARLSEWLPDSERAQLHKLIKSR